MSLIIQILPLFGLAGLFSLPFLVPVHTAPLPGFHAEWLAALLGLITLPSLLRLRERSLDIPHAVGLPIGLAGLLVFGLSVNTDVPATQSLLAILYLLLALAVMLSTAALAASLGRQRLMDVLNGAALVGGMLGCLAAIAQHWELPSPWNVLVATKLSLNAYGNLAQTNHFAAQLAIALAGLFGLHASRRLGLVASLAIATLLLVPLALSGSRSAWLYMATMLIMALAYWWKNRAEPGKRLTYFALTSIALFLFMQQLIGAVHLEAKYEPAPGSKLVVAEVATATDRLAVSQDHLGVRSTLWRHAWQMFIEHPLTGVGHQQFAWQLFQIEADSPYSLLSQAENHVWSHCHNTPLQLLAEFGIGAAVLLAWFTYWLYRAYRAIDSPQHWAILAMLAIILVHSLVEYPLNFLYFLLPTAVLMTLACKDAAHVQLPRLPSIGLFAAGMTYGILMVWQLWEDYRRLEIIQTASMRSVGEISKPHLTDLANLQQDSLLAPQADTLLNRLSISTQRPSTWPPLLGISERVMRNETAASNVYRHILLLALNDRISEASKLLLQAQRVYPDAFETFNNKIVAIRLANPDSKPLNKLTELLKGTMVQ